MESEDLNEYQRRAKRKLRKLKERTAKMSESDLDKIIVRLNSLEEFAKDARNLSNRVDSIEARLEGTLTACVGMCNALDKLVTKLADMAGERGDIGKDIAASLNEDLDAFFKEKVEEIFDCVVKLDESRILCDLCGKDWTESRRTGGIMFAGKACCPECEAGVEEQAIKEEEENYITARCPKNLSHAEWITSIIRPLAKSGNATGLKFKSISEWMEFVRESKEGNNG